MNWEQIDWLRTALLIFGALLLIAAARYAVFIELLLRLRFQPGRSKILPRDRLPASVRQILEVAAPQLAALGFERHLSQAIWNGLVATRGKPQFADIYFHPGVRCFAAVTPAEEPEPGALCAVEFLTCYADGRLLITLNRRLHTIPALPPDWLAEDRYLATLDAHWQAHRERMAALADCAIADDPGEAWRRTRKLQASYLTVMERRGMVRPARPAGTWRFTLRGAWSFMRRLIDGARRAARSRPAAAGEPLRVRALADAFAFGRSMAAVENTPPNWIGKLLLFAASAVLGAVAFGAAWSWQIVPLLLAVLLLHELGHLAAMRLSGYRDLNVFFVPFLGAAAVGRKEDATPWQQLFVYLAGPLPGLVLGALCLYAAAHAEGTARGWLLQLGALALALNLFNLLPFLPLDGGRVVEALLFVRFPRLRLAFAAASSAVLLGAGLYTGDWVLLLIGAIIALALPADLRITGLLRTLRRKGVAAAERKQALRAVFAALAGSARAAKLDFRQRAQTAKAVLPRIMQPLPQLRESALGLALYAVVIAAPVAALALLQPVDLGAGRAALPAGFAPGGSAAAPRMRDWEAELAAAADPAARWQVLYDAGTWYEDGEDYERARHYFRRALELAKELPAGDLRGVDSSIALARTVEESAQAQALYNAALAGLGNAQGPDRLRIADVLEALYEQQPEAPPAGRIGQLRHALAIRESLPESAPARIYTTRRELARLLDADGDTAAAEALLRQNLAAPAGAPGVPGTMLRSHRKDLAWFLMAHQRAAEAETLLQESPPREADHSDPAGEDDLNVALAWAQMLQGKHDAAAARLQALLAGSTAAPAPRGVVKLDVLLDLAQVARQRGDAAAQAKWLGESRLVLEKLPDYVAQSVRTRRYQTLADGGQGWDTARWERHAELAAAL